MIIYNRYVDRIAELPSPNLEVRDLRLVLALLASGSTARAGELLHLAQPSVSRALGSLEERLGTTLFERTSRGLLPTEAGERLGARALDLLGDLGELESELRAPVRQQRLRIVCDWLPATLTALRRRSPGLDLVLRLEHTKEPLPALEAGAIDAALLSTPTRATRALAVKPLFADELLFVVSSRHPLASKEQLAPKDLTLHPLFTPPASKNESTWFLRKVFGRARPRLDVSFVPLVEATVDLARASMGIAIVTEWALGPHLERGGCVAKRLKSGPLERPWHLAWRREIGSAGPMLLSALQGSERGSA